MSWRSKKNNLLNFEFYRVRLLVLIWFSLITAMPQTFKQMVLKVCATRGLLTIKMSSEFSCPIKVQIGRAHV